MQEVDIDMFQKLNGTVPEGATEPITVKFANNPSNNAKLNEVSNEVLIFNFFFTLEYFFKCTFEMVCLGVKKDPILIFLLGLEPSKLTTSYLALNLLSV